MYRTGKEDDDTDVGWDCGWLAWTPALSESLHQNFTVNVLIIFFNLNSYMLLLRYWTEWKSAD